MTRYVLQLTGEKQSPYPVSLPFGSEVYFVNGGVLKVIYPIDKDEQVTRCYAPHQWASVERVEQPDKIQGSSVTSAEVDETTEIPKDVVELWEKYKAVNSEISPVTHLKNTNRKEHNG